MDNYKIATPKSVLKNFNLINKNYNYNVITQHQFRKRNRICNTFTHDDETDFLVSNNNGVSQTLISQQTQNLDERYFKGIRELKASVEFLPASYDEILKQTKPSNKNLPNIISKIEQVTR